MKGSTSSIQSRREKILARLKETGSVSVYEMSHVFDVSESTIRRDFEAMEVDGAIRFHGGMKMMRQERAFEEKNVLSSRPKEAIAEKAAAMIQDGQTVLLNAGTTTLALYRKIKDREICIVTNNAAIMMEPDPGRAEIILVGGQYREKSRSLVGGMASLNLTQTYADICFLGANGVSLTRGMTTLLHMEAELNRAMGERSAKLICIADHSKLGVDAGFVSLPLERIAMLITDSGADPEIVAQLRRKGVGTVLAE